MFKSIILVGLLVASVGVATLNAAPLTYLPVVISNPEQSLTQHQVKLSIDTSSLIAESKLKGNCGDIRIIDSDGLTELPYWVESGCNSLNTSIWVKVPSISGFADTTIYLSYGDPSIESQSDAASVFEFYDSFSGRTLDSEKWSLLVNDGIPYDVIAGYLYIDMTGPANREIIFNSTYAFSESVVIETKSAISNTYGLTGQVGHMLHWFTGKLLVTTTGLSNNTDQGVIYPKGVNSVTREIYDVANSVAKVCYIANCTEFYPVVGGNSNLILRAFDHSYSEVAADSYRIDWLRVRKYAPQQLSFVVEVEVEVVDFVTPISTDCTSCTMADQAALITEEIANIDTNGLSGRDAKRLDRAEELFLKAQAYIAVGDVQRAISEMDKAVDEIIKMDASVADFLLEIVASILKTQVEVSIANLIQLAPDLDYSTPEFQLSSGIVDMDNNEFISAINNFKRSYDSAYKMARRQF